MVPQPIGYVAVKPGCLARTTSYSSYGGWHTQLATNAFGQFCRGSGRTVKVWKTLDGARQARLYDGEEIRPLYPSDEDLREYIRQQLFDGAAIRDVFSLLKSAEWPQEQGADR